MDARPKTVAEILQTGTDQYLIPFFQRHYKWTKKQWERLWLDTVRLMKFPDKERHFLGSMVCTPHRHVPGEVNTYQLIDGQQRITTLTILLTALRNKAAELEMDLEEQIHEGFLVHKWQKGTDHYRVIPRTGDREVLFGIIEGKPPKTTGTNRIKNALRYFRQASDEFLASQEDQKTAVRNLFSLVASRLSMVVITIDDENPYEIFWSLNGKGLPLRQSDLIRNFVFMQVPLEEQEEFNQSHWDRLENLLGESDSDSSSIEATRFYRNFLMRSGVYIRKENIFLEFQNQYALHGATPAAITEELIHFAKIYARVLEPTGGQDDQLTTSLQRLRQLDQATCHPLVMNLLARYEAEEESLETVLECLTDLQSFILRRSICGESTRGYGRLFVEAITKLGSAPNANLKKFLLSKQWPDDPAFVPSLATFDLYRRERKMTGLVLKALEESFGSKEPVDIQKGKITIEHVMPRNITSGQDSQSWREALGSNWLDLHKKHIDTLGNLTLTGYNSELSNSSFAKKKELFKGGSLLLNRYFENQDVWDSEAITNRGHQLSQEVAAIWPRPEGQPYVPTAEVSQEQKRFFVDFWTAFLDLWAEAHPDEKRPPHIGKSFIRFRSARFRVWYYLEVDTDQNLAWVGMYNTGQRGNEFMAALWDEIPDGLLEELDQEHGTQYEYQSAEDRENGVDEIWLEKEVDSFDPSEWPNVHRWMLDALQDFQEAIEPIALELVLAASEDDDDGDDEGDGPVAKSISDSEQEE